MYKNRRLIKLSSFSFSITQDSFTLQIVREGYLIPFKDQKPPLSSRPIDLSSGHPNLQGALQALLEKGAVERVHNPGSLGFYSRLFLVPKKNGSWRPIKDLSTLNSFVDIRSFKMETVTSIRNSILPDHWGVSLDLTDAYFHVPIHPRSRKYLRFCVKGQVFQFRSLPFGLATAPRVFTKFMAVVGAHLRLNGSVILQYFDDWLIHHVQRESLLQDLSRSWVEISSLGLLLNPTKSDLVPSQQFTFVGMNFLTNLNRVRVPPQRSESLRNLVSLFLTKDKVTARSFLSLLGVLSAASSLVELGRLYLRPIQLYLLALWRPNQDSLSDLVPIRPPLLPHLRWWLVEDRLSAGVPIVPPVPTISLITDASNLGWGAHLEPLGLTASGIWSTRDRLLHINNLELKAVTLAVSQFSQNIKDHCVLLSTDNTTVVSYVLKQGGTHSLSLFRETLELFQRCQSLNVRLLAKHLPGRLNVLADSLSRRHQILPSEWTLQQEVVNLIFRELGTPMVDLFATRFNHRLPLYVSPVLDPAAWAIDALSLDWNQLVAYAFPPFILLPQVLRKIRLSQCQILLIAPLWPQRCWFSDLLELLRAHPRPLPQRHDLLFQRDRVLHPCPDVLHLHVWPLSGRLSERNAFRKELPLSSLSPGEIRPLRSTMPSGIFSQIGVADGILIHSIRLPDV